MKNNLYITLFFLLLIGCAGEKSVFTGRTINILSSSKIESLPINTNKQLFDYELVPLETNDNSILSSIDQIEVMDSCIYVLDTKLDVVRKFNRQGRYIQNIGSLGKGPSEYLAINAFYVNRYEQTINIFDPLKQMVHRYDLNGKYLISIKFKDEDLGFVGKASLILPNSVFCYSETNWHKNCEFLILNENDYSIQDCLYNYPFTTNKNISFHFANSPYCQFEDTVRFVSPFTDIVYAYNSGKILPAMLITKNKLSIDEETLQTIAKKNDNNFINVLADIEQKNQYTNGLRNIFETQDYLCCEFFSDHIVSECILWDKRKNTSLRITDYCAVSPNFGSIFHCADNSFVRIWREDEIETFKTFTRDGHYKRNEYPNKIWDIVDNYTIEDNPILIFYTPHSHE